MISNYTVSGMTCDHCVRAVTEEVEAITGVQQADVDLANGSLTVTSERALDFHQISAAVDEAGDYTVTTA